MKTSGNMPFLTTSGPASFRTTRPSFYLLRAHRISHNRPLVLRWPELHEMFGGELSLKHFKVKFPKDLLAAKTAYPEARIEPHPEGYL